MGHSGGEYPRYESIRSETIEVFGKFAQFVEERLGKIHFNQWEVSYNNHLPRGTVLNDAR